MKWLSHITWILFRPMYSSEMALVMLADDLWRAPDGDGATVLDLLDLSGAFDLSVTFDTLIPCYPSGLAPEVGNGRQYFAVVLLLSPLVLMGEESSSLRPCNVQCFRNWLFHLSSLTSIWLLDEVIQQHGVQYHQYVDDMQLFFSTLTFLCLHGRRVSEPALEHPKGPIMAQVFCSLFYWLDLFYGCCKPSRFA